MMTSFNPTGVNVFAAYLSGAFSSLQYFNVPAVGFGEHPHSNVEICTYVVKGKLTHQDSMGTQETLERGAIQFMVRIAIVGSTTVLVA